MQRHRHATYVLRIPPNLQEQVFVNGMSLLTSEEQTRVLSFVRREDQLTRLFSGLLLRFALREHDLSTQICCQLKYNEYGRPEHKDCYFNISHSGTLVACTFSRDAQAGIDIEAVLPICFEDFKSYFTSTEWETIYNAEFPSQSFYSFWTKKEALIKADGRGLSFPLDNILLKKDTGMIEGKTYQLKELDIGAGFVGHLATPQPALCTMVSIDADILICQS